MGDSPDTNYMNVQRMAFPLYLPVFLKKDLAARYGVDSGRITRWIADGRFPEMDVRDAEGKGIGWTWTTIAINEAHDTDLISRFRKLQVTMAVPVMSDT